MIHCSIGRRVSYGWSMDVRQIEIRGRVTGWATRLCTMTGCQRLVEWPTDEPSAPVCVECWDAAVDRGDWLEEAG